VNNTRHSYRDFPLDAFLHALLEFVAKALSAVGERFTIQSKSGSQSFAAVDTIAIILLIVRDDQLLTLGLERVQTIFQTGQPDLLLSRFVRAIYDGKVVIIRVERSQLAIFTLQRLQTYETRYLVAIAINVSNLDSRIQFLRDAIEDLIGLLFRKGSAPPFKKPGQGPAQMLIRLAGVVWIGIQTSQEVSKRLGRQFSFHQPSQAG
jgi:hypothetical protein